MGTIWLTGQSGAGKSTLAEGLHRRFVAAGEREVALLDGEDIRRRLPRSFGHSLEDRADVLRATVDIARDVTSSGSIAIVATISHQAWMRDHARAHLRPFLEILLYCPTSACAARDQKGHYARAFAGEYDCFVGVTHPYEVSGVPPDLRIDTKVLSVNQVLDVVWPACKAFTADGAEQP